MRRLTPKEILRNRTRTLSELKREYVETCIVWRPTSVTFHISGDEGDLLCHPSHCEMRTSRDHDALQSVAWTSDTSWHNKFPVQFREPSSESQTLVASSVMRQFSISYVTHTHVSPCTLYFQVTHSCTFLWTTISCVSNHFHSGELTRSRIRIAIACTSVLLHLASGYSITFPATISVSKIWMLWCRVVS